MFRLHTLFARHEEHILSTLFLGLHSTVVLGLCSYLDRYNQQQTRVEEEAIRREHSNARIWYAERHNVRGAVVNRIRRVDVNDALEERNDVESHGLR